MAVSIPTPFHHIVEEKYHQGRQHGADRDPVKRHAHREPLPNTLPSVCFLIVLDQFGTVITDHYAHGLTARGYL
jgi:hypothetical protein